ncbi:ImuA family protein [Pedobacter miscanthi]|uniref:Error-prone repair protein ImuA n=1 Tax=Pedobacter miscanthi TaxID=2259170 RepID=A0A366KYP5_9SPHI|nr:Error-prone repair protein ImuA [Pedobacter miscanthi]RBQ06708.1 Error-prone repair protein ImuA [Pedobacter miscanthi]
MEAKRELIEKLQQDILLWQGFKALPSGHSKSVGLGSIEKAFPGGVFPRGVIHEFLNFSPEHSAASDGFIAGLLSVLMNEGAACAWISSCRKVYPASLKAFNADPERIIFMDVELEKDALWIVEEALKTEGLAAVVAEVSTLSLVESRRLQLAVEKSGVTGFILRRDAKGLSSTIATARWRITPLPSETEDGLPGLGFPRWNVELLKVRSGMPGSWTMEWAADQFAEVKPQQKMTAIDYRRSG